MEKWKKALVRLGLVTLVPLTLPSFAEDYEAKICYNCNETEAKEFALSKEFEPNLTCYADDVFSPSFTQQCYSQPNQVLVANYATGQIWGFDVYHDNQGSPEYLISVKAKEFVVQDNVRNLMSGVLETYSRLDATIDAVNRDLENPENVFGSQGGINLGSRSLSAVGTLFNSSSSNCSDSSPMAKAVRAAYDPRTIAKSLDYIQSEYRRRYGNPAVNFEYSRLNGINFSVGLGNVGIGGTWEYVSVTRLLEAEFTSDVPLTETNKISYNVSYENNAIDISVNESRSRIDGLPLSSLKRGRVTDVSPCLLELLNKYLEASIQSDASGGNFGDGGAPRNYGRGYGFIPSSGSGSGGGYESCTWRFYDLEGNPSFTMQGPCP